MILPSLTRVWNAMAGRDFKEFPVKNDVPPALESLKDFVTEYLHTTSGTQKSYETNKNGMTLAVLNLADSLLLYGFYQEERELIEMVDPLISQLNGTNDVTTPEEELALKRMETAAANELASF